MILLAQSPYLYDSERLAIVRKEYRAFPCLYFHSFLSQPVQQVISLACHITLCLMFLKFLQPLQLLLCQIFYAHNSLLARLSRSGSTTVALHWSQQVPFFQVG